ncbi:MAG: hypothetical protein IKY38_00125 [Anaerotignum sp.]|nr:hypothetical protein [Anaerotignum sp.]MBR5815809.1 hypothetical protein [Anaerotignum sp.]
MVDFTNSSENMMNLDSVKHLYARMDSIYRRIIDQLVDPDDIETQVAIDENMPSLLDYVMEVGWLDQKDPIIDERSQGLEVDMDELYDLCEFFDANPNELFILED